MNNQYDEVLSDAGGEDASSVPLPGVAIRQHHRGARSQCKGSVMCLLSQHNRYDARGVRQISDATRRERGDFLLRCVNDLHENGFKLRDITNLCTKHITSLVRLWEQRGYSAAALQKYKSYLHTLLVWSDNLSLANHLDRIVREAKSEFGSFGLDGDALDDEASRAAICDASVALEERLFQETGSLREISLGLEELRSQGICVVDTHAKNIGYGPDGVHKIFDVGVASSPQTQVATLRGRTLRRR